MSSLYPLIAGLHYWISRIGLAAAVGMFALGIFIGLVRHGDVTHYYRRAVYTVAGVMVLQSVIGLAMYFMGARPAEDVHFIYGMGTVLALPFSFLWKSPPKNVRRWAVICGASLCWLASSYAAS